jgi:hypothetical protein
MITQLFYKHITNILRILGSVIAKNKCLGANMANTYLAGYEKKTP